MSVRSVRVFFISLALVFLMVLIPQLGIKANKLISPQAPKVDLFENIKPRLEQNKSNFQLQKSIIPIVSAGSRIDEAAAYGVVDFDSGEVLASKNLSAKVPIASLTKIMTAVVAIDLASLDETFTVSETASAQIPTKVMLKQGEKFKLEELLNSLLIASANDSAQVIKEGIDNRFGEEVFIRAMNAKAQFLNLKNTHFSNPQGFDDLDHFSSVEDLAILSHYALENYPALAKIVEKEFEDYNDDYQDSRFFLNNWNGLLGVYPGVMGIKTGNTERAGTCTIVLSKREGKQVLAIVLGAPGVLERDLWASQLLDLGFNQLLGLKPVNITEGRLKEKYATWKYFE